MPTHVKLSEAILTHPLASEMRGCEWVWVWVVPGWGGGWMWVWVVPGWGGGWVWVVPGWGVE